MSQVFTVFAIFQFSRNMEKKLPVADVQEQNRIR